MSEILKNPKQVADWLNANGFSVAQATVYNHINQGKLRATHRDGFTVQAVKNYAIVHWPRLTDTEEAAPDNTDVQAKKLRSEAELKQAQAARARLNLDLAAGKLVAVDTFARELAARVLALKTGLKSFPVRAADEVAALFGADPAEAEKLCLLVDGDPAKSQAIAQAQLKKSAEFVALVAQAVTDELARFAGDDWFTPEMAQAFEKFEEHGGGEI